jgi:hypothetical protein
MTVAEYQFYDVVRIGESDETRSLELVGAEGVMLGLSEDEATGEKWFVVQVGATPAVMLPSRELTPLGQSVPRTSLYLGDHVRVSEEGRVIGHDANRTRPPDDGAKSGPA